jgi:hypothetical protein
MTEQRAALLALVTFLALAAGSSEGKGSANREKWDSATLGNHRAVLRVEAKADAVLAHIPWRRRDAAPESKALLVVEAATGAVIQNVARLEIRREFGDLAFQAAAGPGDYFVYYLPYRVEGRSNYPKVIYPAPEPTTDPAWLERHGLDRASPSPDRTDALPRARFLRLESVDEFDTFDPMELIATREETDRLLAAHPGAGFLVLPEDRRFPIRMADDLPWRWAQRGPGRRFRGDAARGEFYAFQIGVWACRADVPGLKVSSSDLREQGGSGVIPADAFRCFNLGGANWDGTRFEKEVSVPRGKIQALWCGVQVPPDAAPGTYEGSVTVGSRDGALVPVALSLRVGPGRLEDAGDSDPGRQSRLRWLDSTIAFDDQVVAPFTPVTVSDRTFGILGRTMTITGPLGLPASLESFFSPDVTGLVERGREILAGPVDLVVKPRRRAETAWSGAPAAVTERTEGLVRWRGSARTEGFTAEAEARLEFDGFVEYRVTLTATADQDLDDVSLRIPINPDAARYMMGLGRKGGRRPARFHWMWDPRNNQDAVWVGDVNAGFQCSLRGTNYSRPLNTNFYLSKPLRMPPAWWNDGRGGILLQDEPDGTVLLRAYSGPRRVKAEERLDFFFHLLLTPFKPLDIRGHFSNRYFHAFKPVDEVAATGANTINVHHANAVNPYINYPFLRPEAMKRYIDEAHARGLKVKIYYTIRELSNHAPELFALRSLGHEIFSPGPGGGFSWLQEHLGSDYIAAWFVPELKDAAVINSGMSRWHNYYLEGLDWLCRNVGIDGLYLDDLAFDRTTMKRVRKILDRRSPGALIDLHSANQFNPRDGYASSANLYLEHFPYLNRLWFGEYFDYGSAPDYWLVEISGIPFGLMGEMLEGGGNPWRGMVYGMTNRLPWSGRSPAGLWKAWDEFGILDSRMIGYWSEACPVKTGSDAVPATAYVRPGRTMVALASWAGEKVEAALTIDWKALGLDPAKAVLTAPAIPDFQEAMTFQPGQLIPVEPGKGWLLIIENK